MRIFSIILFALIVGCITVRAEVLNVVGFVKNEQTGEPIAFANVYFKGTSLGTRTDMMGRFEIMNRSKMDTLSITAVGFKTQEIAIAKIRKAPLEVLMPEESYTLGEVVIRPNENPAHRIIRNAIGTRGRNNPEKIARYSCTTYTKFAVFLDNTSKNDSTLSSRMLHKQLKDPKLPIFFSEKLANNHIDQEKGIEKMDIIAKQQSGLGILDDIQIDGYSTAMNTEINFYQNKIALFGKVFPNPIGDNAFTYYKFKLKDSTFTGDQMQYTIDFKPRHKKDLAFRGTMLVLGDSWNIASIETELPKEANINFLNSFEVKYEYQRVNDTLTFFKKNDIRAKLYYRKAEKTAGITTLSVNKTTLYHNIAIGTDSTTNIPSSSSMAGLRPVMLTPDELKMNHSIDSLNRLWWMKGIDKLSTAALTGYFPLGQIDFGPYASYVRHNKVEGLRFTMAARTGESFHPNYSIAGKLGYGNKDAAWKYGAGFTFKPNLERRLLMGIEFDRDMTIIGSNGNLRFIRENSNAPEDENIITSLTCQRPNDKLSIRDIYSVWAEQELRRGITSRLRVEHQQVQSGLFVPFTQKGIPVPNISGYTVSLEGRFSFDEKTLDKFIRRYYLGSKYPIVNVALTLGNYSVLDKHRYYAKAYLSLKHSVVVGLGRISYVVEGGIIQGKVPFPLLEVHRGNETYGLTRYRFNTMNNLQLASDRFASLFAEYHLNGQFVNRIPLIRALNLREVFSAKVLVGSLAEKHRRIMDFPTILNGMEKPLVEVGAGFENILRFFRIEGVYRLSSQTLEQSPRFCVKARFQVEF